MKVLITGGAGFIGSHIAEHFSGKANVRILDNLRSGSQENISGLDVEFLNGSILDTDILKYACNQVDYVFHLAALISVPESMAKPVETVTINSIGTLNVLKAATEAGAKKVVFSSTASIYGDNPTVPKMETMTPEPKCPYAVTKLDGEYYMKMFKQEGWVDTVSLRYFNVYGPRQNPKSAYAAAVASFVNGAVKNEVINIHGDGEQIRDFINVKDIVAANVYFGMTSDASGTFNVASGNGISILNLAKQIIEKAGSSSQLKFTEARAGDVRTSIADISKAQIADWKPNVTLDDGIEHLIQDLSCTT